MAQPVVHASRYYRELENGDSVLAVCRPEDQLWHAEHVRADGRVVEWRTARPSRAPSAAC